MVHWRAEKMDACAAFHLVPSTSRPLCGPSPMDAQADLWAALAALGVMQRKPNGDVRLWTAADGLYQFAVQIHPIYLLFFRITSPMRSSLSYGYATASSDRPANVSSRRRGK